MRSPSPDNTPGGPPRGIPRISSERSPTCRSVKCKFQRRGVRPCGFAAVHDRQNALAPAERRLALGPGHSARLPSDRHLRLACRLAALPFRTRILVARARSGRSRIHWIDSRHPGTVGIDRRTGSADRGTDAGTRVASQPDRLARIRREQGRGRDRVAGESRAAPAETPDRARNSEAPLQHFGSSSR